MNFLGRGKQPLPSKIHYAEVCFSLESSSKNVQSRDLKEAYHWILTSIIWISWTLKTSLLKNFLIQLLNG